MFSRELLRARTACLAELGQAIRVDDAVSVTTALAKACGYKHFLHKAASLLRQHLRQMNDSDASVAPA